MSRGPTGHETFFPCPNNRHTMRQVRLGGRDYSKQYIVIVLQINRRSKESTLRLQLLQK